MQFKNDIMIILVIALYTLREALRNRILWIALVFSVMGIGLASFIGDVALVEHEIVEVIFLAAAYRLCAVLVLMVLVISTLVREFNDKCLELYLSLTISRLIYFVGKMFGFFLVGALLAAIFGSVLLLYASTIDVVWWSVSLACELAIVAAVGVFCVMSFNQQIPSSFAASLIFYFMCRAADAIKLISTSDLIVHTTGASVMRNVIDTIVYVLPSLGRFTKTDWLAYGYSSEITAGISTLSPMLFIVLQTCIYVALISAATMIDFSRKNI
ncbi:MAG: hypothetical protein ACNYPH_05920 [Gammaproteobacteria bacterium WSBS_2016_MAG_OTU1]